MKEKYVIRHISWLLDPYFPTYKSDYNVYIIIKDYKVSTEWLQGPVKAYTVSWGVIMSLVEGLYS